MRVLFCCTPGTSKLFSLVPLAWAAQSAGHDVLVTFAQQTDVAATTGLQVVDVAPGYDWAAMFRGPKGSVPRESVTSAHAPMDQNTAYAMTVAAMNRPLVDRAVETARQWRPDLVVYEQTATYGLVVAAHVGVPAVQRNLGIIRTNDLHATTGELLGAPALPRPGLILEYVPPSMLPHSEPEGVFMRYLPYVGGGMTDLPEPHPDRPRVVITMGATKSVAHRLHGLSKTLTAAAELDAEFLLALGGVDPGQLPPNVLPIGWTPMNLLLRTSTAVIHHGGGGTTMAAVAAGTPQLLAGDPRFLDHQTMGAAVQSCGIGIVASQDEVTPEMLTRLITDEKLRKATMEVREEWASLPSPAELLPRLLELAQPGG
ncbi:nucleotide disphospho-sugar-binding domain-containing protein [Nonomuraea sp. NPDC049400]|uniref:nucleotide disphospho-sugar-binding domain-containing protein n=1 Tax=Nonomuraea sp. NPDC049400 TaxID=3364352 RepID=UPI0037B8EDB9